MLTDASTGKHQGNKGANYSQDKQVKQNFSESYITEFCDSDSERQARYCVSMPILHQIQHM